MSLPAILTVGHSTQDAEAFTALLRQHSVTAVADVRSSPYSRFNPQFNREALQRHLREKDIAYVFLGEELGARSNDPGCYSGGQVQFDRLARTALFQSGLDRAVDGAARYRLALMCAEKDPLDCHRAILVARELQRRGRQVEHILEDGALESHPDAIDRLLERLHLNQPDLFRSKEDLIEDAYRIQADRIAFREDPSAPATSTTGSRGQAQSHPSRTPPE